MYRLKDGAGKAVGLLVSILGHWTVSQLQCCNCPDYRYIWYVAFPSTAALWWPGLIVLQVVTLVTTLVSPCSQMDSSLYHLPCHVSSPDTALQLVVTVCFPHPSRKMVSDTTSAFHQDPDFWHHRAGSLAHGDMKGSCSFSPRDQQIQFPHQKGQTECSSSSLPQVWLTVPPSPLLQQSFLDFLVHCQDFCKQNEKCIHRVSIPSFSLSFPLLSSSYPLLNCFANFSCKTIQQDN